MEIILLFVVAALQIVALFLGFGTLQKYKNTDAASLRGQWEAIEKGQVRLETVLRDEIAGNRREISEQLAIFSRGSVENSDKLTAKIAEAFHKLVSEQATHSKSAREEVGNTLKSLAENIDTNQKSVAALQKTQLEVLIQRLVELSQNSRSDAEQLRESLSRECKAISDSLRKQAAEIATLQKNQLAVFGEHLTGISQSSDAKLDKMREEQGTSLGAFNESVSKRINDMALQQRTQLDSFGKQVGQMSDGADKRMETLRASVEDKLTSLQADNSQKLDQMRATVDEKLQGTLEKRLGESFGLVSERLEQVQRGLGEMSSLATGVGDLKKVLTNVKTRGTWGEVQLGNLLEQILTPEQFETNVAVKKGGERVEFAIKMPGRDEDNSQVWLPIDAKFPQEDYLRLVEAQDNADLEAIARCGKALEAAVKSCAQTICSKYIEAPHTTDFALLYLPTEGLYAEVIRRVGLVETLQRECRVVITGPTTIAALLNALQMGFKTLAIQKQSSEVWKTLGKARTEFGKYTVLIEKASKEMEKAQKTLGEVEKRNTAVQRTLRDVEALPNESEIAVSLTLALTGSDETHLEMVEE